MLFTYFAGDVQIFALIVQYLSQKYEKLYTIF